MIRVEDEVMKQQYEFELHLLKVKLLADITLELTKKEEFVSIKIAESIAAKARLIVYSAFNGIKEGGGE